MTELVVVSGKGGTGKTSIVGALSALASDKVMVDCDVDAADLHLIMDYKIKAKTVFIGGKKASIITDKCTACGQCQTYCRYDAVKHDDSSLKYRIEEFSCEGCGVCVRHCPENAISFDDTISGEWYFSETTHGPLIHARLGIAQSNSGKLVSLLRDKARQIAGKYNKDLILIDGPPGIGCPVIASLTGVDYVLIVTEPSMSAIHDMERLLELTAHFKLPSGICINKHDINPRLTSHIKNFAWHRNIKIVGQIPYDHSVINAQLAKTTVIEKNDNNISEYFTALWSELSQEINLENKKVKNIKN